MGCSKNYRKANPGRRYNQNPTQVLDGIQPGPCPFNVETGQYECPQPTELVCIKTEKVYESCRVVDTNEEIADLNCVAVGQIEFVECLDVELVVNEQYPFVCQKIPNTNRARVSFWYRYRFTYFDQSGQKFFTSEPIFHERTVILSDRIFEKQLFVQCEVFLECFECFVSGPQQVTCCISKLLVFKLAALVQLLIPAYGFCPEPDLCVDVLADCPDFDPGWPPFPPQEDNNIEG